MMSNTRRNIRLGIFLNIGIGIVFLIAAVIAVISVNDGMHRQALMEAESKARIILDRNLATHTYFTKIMKPKISKWTESFRTKDYFDPTWMSSTFAIREIEKYFKASNPSGYFFKDAALDARSPENEAEGYERLFLEKINADKKLETESSVRRIDGKPFLVVLRRGEVMEASCLKCHANPKDAPKGLIDFYGSERSFNRKAGDAVSAVSLRIPLAEAYAEADIFSLKLSTFLIVVLACLFTAQYWFYRRYLLKPLHVMQEKAAQIAAHDEHLGEQIPQPLGRELGQLATAFNEMSVKLRHDRDHLEELVEKRTAELKLANEQFRQQRDFSKSLINTAQVILLVLDTEGRIVNFNPYLEEISGYTLEEVEGRDWFSIFLPESDRQRGREFFLKAVGTFQSKGKVDPILTKDGRLREIEWYDKTLKDTEGRVIGLLVIGHDVTERKRAEEALRESEEKFRTIFENSSSAMAIIERDTTISMVNREYCKMGLYEEKDVIGTSWTKQIPPEDLERLKEYNRKRLIDPKSAPDHYEFKFYRKDGQIRDSLMSVAIIPTSQKIICSFADITERKRTEEALRQSEALFREAQAAAHIGHWELDTSIMRPRWSEEIFHIFGLDPEKGEPSFAMHQEITHPDDWDILNNAVTTSIAEGTPFDIEFRVLRPDKTIRWMHAIGYPKRDSEGRMESVFGTAQDITERKRAEEALRESKEFVENLIASMQDGFSVLDSDGVQMDANPAFCQMTGFSREELIGVGLPHPYWPPEAYEEIEKGFQKTLRGEFSDVELTFMRKTGERFPVIVSPSWVKDKQGNVTGYFATVKDITERKRAEEEKRRLEERSRKVVEDIFRFIPEGVLVFSRKMELLRQNQAFRELVSGYAKRLGFAEDELENLIINKIKAGMGDKNLKEIRISRKHETGK